MKKRTSTNRNEVEENTLKRQKVQKDHAPKNKEIYWFNKNTFRTFNTPTIKAFCLHSTEPLLAVYSDVNWPLFTPVVRIYTLDGNLVTAFRVFLNYLNNPVRGPVTIHLSAYMMLTIDLSECILRYNDYNMKNIQLSPSCLECDMLNNIYVHDCSKLNKIDIYSPDLEYVRTFNVPGPYAINSIRIQEDTMVILSSEILNHHHDLVMLKYSLSQEELLQTIRLNKHFFLRRLIHLTFDPVGNVLISCNQCQEIAVWYLGGRIRYYKTPGESMIFSFVVGLAMSKNFQLIRAISYGSIRIYEPK